MNNTGAHLGQTPLNIAKLRDLSRKALPEILDKVSRNMNPNHRWNNAAINRLL
jgi:hypothetical protein